MTKWPEGKSLNEFYKAIARNRNRILTGTVVAIDPSSGGTSAPGFAIFRQGTLECKGSVAVNKKLKVNERLQIIYDRLNTLLPQPPDLLVVEKIRGSMSPPQLFFSVGVALAAVRSPIALEMASVVWRAYAGRDYWKAKREGETDDADDAEMIGLALIELAKGKAK